MNPFKFQLGQQVYITCSKEQGQIIGRAEYTTGMNNYLVRYCGADGRAVEAWWTEDALTSAA